MKRYVHKPVTTLTVCCSSKFILTLIGLVALPVIFPQTTVCTANVHTVVFIGMSVQVTVVRLVVVGQLPQFDARML